MARPRTLGPTITFRLPIDLHAIAEERARLKGMTVNEYLAGRVTDALIRQRDAEGAAPIPPSVPHPPPAARQVTPRWKESMKP